MLDQINKQIIEKEKDIVESMKKLNAKYIKESQDIQIKLVQGFEKVSILLIHILQFCKSVSLNIWQPSKHKLNNTSTTEAFSPKSKPTLIKKL